MRTPDRPKSLVQFDRLFLLARAVGAAPALWAHAQAYREKTADLDAIGIPIYYTLIFWPLVPPLVLWFFVSRKASRIATWLLFAFVAYEILALVVNGLNPTPEMTPYLWALLAVVVLDGAAVVLLNRRDARMWLERLRRSGGIDPETFS